MAKMNKLLSMETELGVGRFSRQKLTISIQAVNFIACLGWQTSQNTLKECQRKNIKSSSLPFPQIIESSKPGLSVGREKKIGLDTSPLWSYESVARHCGDKNCRDESESRPGFMITCDGLMGCTLINPEWHNLGMPKM